MRPRRLEMEGFLAYRRRTTVDFDDADLFVLSGPTGAGKSSVIDAMIFALYGTIPRLDDRRVVEPVISVRSARARVALSFTVAGEEYRVARMVERRKSGATTTEARLERGEEVLASGAGEVTEAVGELLGLGFDHFTRAVVLPQGAFARFLLDQPRERQGLLRALLDLGLFEQVMQLANARAAAAKARVEAVEEGLGKLQLPGEEELRAARLRLGRLEAAQPELGERLASLASLVSRIEAAAESERSLRQSMERLGALRPPDLLETWESERDRTREAAAAAEELLAAAAAEIDAVEGRLSQLPPRATLEGWVRARGRLLTLEEQRAGLDLDRLRAEAEAATEDRDRLRTELDLVQVANAAHLIRSGLHPGEACPVCRGVVGELGDEPPPYDQEEALARVRAAEREADLARDRLKEAEGAAGQLEAAIEEARGGLADVPGPDLISAQVEAVTTLEQERERAVERRDRAAEAAEGARWRLEALEGRGADLHDALLQARDLMAADAPPRPGPDVVESWRALVAWRDQCLEDRARRLEEAAGEWARLSGEVEEAESRIAAWLGELGVVPATSPETDLALAVERARAEVTAMEQTLEQAAALEAEAAEEGRRRRVAADLAKHLRANNFEAWITEEALDVLVEGANRLLDDLSGGAYSLVVRDRQFQVVDHLNAAALRTTKGLSGGETFLVSLSLALSMAEQLAELTGTTSRLESVFLDEGFGSLDQESLDVVAAILDELVGRGRMVGIVTHVPDLADRIPVRFEVSKGVESATVRKVDQ